MSQKTLQTLQHVFTTLAPACGPLPVAAPNAAAPPAAFDVAHFTLEGARKYTLAVALHASGLDQTVGMARAMGAIAMLLVPRPSACDRAAFLVAMKRLQITARAVANKSVDYMQVRSTLAAQHTCAMVLTPGTDTPPRPPSRTAMQEAYRALAKAAWAVRALRDLSTGCSDPAARLASGAYFCVTAGVALMHAPSADSGPCIRCGAALGVRIALDFPLSTDGLVCGPCLNLVVDECIALSTPADFSDTVPAATQLESLLRGMLPAPAPQTGK